MPTSEMKAVLSIGWMDARHPEKGATGLVWLLSPEQAESLKEEFTASYGKPISSMIPGEPVQQLHDHPDFVLNVPDANPGTGNHFRVQVGDEPEGVIVCNCGVEFDFPGDLARHLEAEN